MKRIALLLSLSFLQHAVGFTIDDVNRLRVRSPKPTGGNFTAIAARGSQVVAVTNTGEVASSLNDGVDWQSSAPFPRQSTSSLLRFETLSSVAHSPTAWIVGSQSRNFYLRSTDAVTWERRSAPQALFQTGYGNGRFVSRSVGSNHILISEDDGLTWGQFSSPSDSTGSAVSLTFFNGLFVLVTQQTIHTSPDGETWNAVSIDLGQGQLFLSTSRAGNSLWALGGNGLLYTTDNGSAWTKRDLGTTEFLDGVVQAEPGGGWRLYQTFRKTFLIPANFSSITEDRQGSSFRHAVITDNGAIVGAGGFGQLVRQAPGATSFSDRAEKLSDFINSVTFDNGRFIIADNSAGLLFSSEDGQNWTFRFNLPSGERFGSLVRAQGGNFVIFSDNTTYTSSDGIDWTSQNVGFSPISGRVYQLNSQLVIAITRDGGRASAFAVTSDGITWSIQDTNNLDFRPVNLTFGAGLYVTVNGTSIWTSPDLVTWTERTATDRTADGYANVGYGGGRFLAIPSRGESATSTDGITWTEVTSGRTFFGSSQLPVIYNEGLGFYSSVGGQRLTFLPDDSPLSDGFTDGAFFPAAVDLTDLAEGNGILVAVGSGFLLSSSSTSEAYELWVADNFPANASSSDTGPFTDPDRDLQTNLEEYARSTNPLQTTPMLDFVRNEGSFGPEYRFEQRAGLDDLNTILEYSSDLDDWNTTGLLQSTNSLGNNREEIQGRLTGQLGNSEKLFLRARWQFSR